MSLHETTVTLGEELDRYADAYAAVRENGADADLSIPESQAVSEYLTTLDNIGDALQWLAHGDDRDDGFDGYGEDAAVEIRALDAGERARVTDRAADLRARSDAPGGLPGAAANVYAAAALIDGPMLEQSREDFSSDDEWLMHKLAQITEGVHPGVPDWLQTRSNELTESGNSRPWHERSKGSGE